MHCDTIAATPDQFYDTNIYKFRIVFPGDLSGVESLVLADTLSRVDSSLPFSFHQAELSHPKAPEVETQDSSYAQPQTTLVADVEMSIPNANPSPQSPSSPATSHPTLSEASSPHPITTPSPGLHPLVASSWFPNPPPSSSPVIDPPFLSPSVANYSISLDAASPHPISTFSSTSGPLIASFPSLSHPPPSPLVTSSLVVNHATAAETVLFQEEDSNQSARSLVGPLISHTLSPRPSSPHQARAPITSGLEAPTDSSSLSSQSRPSLSPTTTVLPCPEQEQETPRTAKENADKRGARGRGSRGRGSRGSRGRGSRGRGVKGHGKGGGLVVSSDMTGASEPSLDGGGTQSRLAATIPTADQGSSGGVGDSQKSGRKRSAPEDVELADGRRGVIKRCL